MEHDLGVQTCGRATIECWRGDIKRLLYGNANAPPATFSNGTLDIAALNLPASVSRAFGPNLHWCHCLLRP